MKPLVEYINERLNLNSRDRKDLDSAVEEIFRRMKPRITSDMLADWLKQAAHNKGVYLSDVSDELAGYGNADDLIDAIDSNALPNFDKLMDGFSEVVFGTEYQGQEGEITYRLTYSCGVIQTLVDNIR